MALISSRVHYIIYNITRYSIIAVYNCYNNTFVFILKIWKITIIIRNICWSFWMFLYYDRSLLIIPRKIRKSFKKLYICCRIIFRFFNNINILGEINHIFFGINKFFLGIYMESFQKRPCWFLFGNALHNNISLYSSFFAREKLKKNIYDVPRKTRNGRKIRYDS